MKESIVELLHELDRPGVRIKPGPESKLTIYLFLIFSTMKESIGELLHELDQTRSGDKTWDQNQSFGLNKLMKIIEEESWWVK